MNSSPTVSIIMPVYNAGMYLKTAVNSVLNQTLKELEIICVNDHSADNSLEILKALAKEDDRIIIIDSKQNVGAGEARNLGLEKARGEYIAFMDADDSIGKDLYKKAVECAKRLNADEVVWGLTEEHYDKSGRFKKSVLVLPDKRVCKTKSSCMETIIELEHKTLFGYQWNSIYKTEIIRKQNIKFEKTYFYEDFFFNLAVARHIKTLATLDFAGYHYFKRVNGSITNRFSKDYFDLSYRRITKMLSFYKEQDAISQRVYHVLGNRFLRYTLSAICRNFNKQSGMNGADHKKWFLECCKKPLYRELLPNCRPTHPVYTILKYAILKQNAPLALFIGRMVSFFI